jgi:hypothetical protein
MRIFVESLNDKEIFIRIYDANFIASNGGVSLFLDDDLADKLSFQIGSCLQDKDVVKNKLDIK